MLTTTEITGEETQDKKNPRFLILLLALFIIAGIGYSAYWWITQKETILPIAEETIITDDSAKAWYEAQKRITEASLGLVADPATTQASSMDSVANSTAVDSSTVEATVTSSMTANTATTTVTAAPTTTTTAISTAAAPTNRSTVLITKSSTNTITAPTTRTTVPITKSSSPVTTKTVTADLPPKEAPTAFQPVKQKIIIADNIKRSVTRSKETAYQAIDQPSPLYNGSIPPTNNKRPLEQAYRPVQQRPTVQANNSNDYITLSITREELEEFMRQYPYRKMTIQFVGYSKPTETMEGIKAQIIQFLRQNGYTDIDTQWHIWSDHTPVKEVHYGKYGATGANFYIPSVQ